MQLDPSVSLCGAGSPLPCFRDRAGLDCVRCHHLIKYAGVESRCDVDGTSAVRAFAGGRFSCATTTPSSSRSSSHRPVASPDIPTSSNNSQMDCSARISARQRTPHITSVASPLGSPVAATNSLPKPHRMPPARMGAGPHISQSLTRPLHPGAHATRHLAPPPRRRSPGSWQGEQRRERKQTHFQSPAVSHPYATRPS